MENVTVRDLRNKSGQVLDRVARGESVVVTMDGREVAELRPLAARPLPAALLLERWKHLPPVNHDKLRSDLDRVLDTTL
jgi:prevent-host-death family protein